MTDSRESETQVNSSWECIDPTVGTCLWELEVATTGSDRCRQLEAHLQLCDACRLNQALKSRLEDGLQSGKLHLPISRNRSWWQQPAAHASAGSLLIAACLALLILMPPAPAGDSVHLRSVGEGPHFLRPVEGEVVLPASATVSWLPIDGATRYEVTVTGTEDDFHWVGTTRETQLKLPDLENNSQTLRAVLTTVPADLVAPGRVSVCFRTGGKGLWAQDRLAKAPWWWLLPGFCGVFLLGFSLVTKKTR